MKKLLFLILFIFISPLLSAEEKVSNYEVVFKIDENAAALVEETITFNAEHDKVRRKFGKVIPLEPYQEVRFYQITLDGEKPPFELEKVRNDTRIRILGSPYIPQGEHTLKLVYTITNAIKPHSKYDELSPSISGYGLNLPIEKASILILPQTPFEVIEEDISFSTGPIWSKENNISFKKLKITEDSITETTVEYNSLYFETTSPVNGPISIDIPFKKGFIKLSKESKLKIFIKSYMSICLLILMIFYCFATWFLFGREPKSGRIFYAPPTEISPTLAKYIRYREPFPANYFSTPLLSLAVKGKVKIKIKKGTLRLTRLTSDTHDLPLEEKYIMENLFNQEEIFIGKGYQERIHKIAKETFSLIKKEGRRFINNNYILYIIPSIFLILIQYYSLDLSYLIGNILILALGLYFAHSRSIISISFFIFMVLFVMFRSDTILTLNEFLFFTNFVVFLIYVVCVDCISSKGRKIYLDILAFENYINYIRSIIKNKTPLPKPEEGEAAFAKYLPYAYTLGLRFEWEQYFSTALDNYSLYKDLNTIDDIAILSLDSYISKVIEPPKRNNFLSRYYNYEK